MIENEVCIIKYKANKRKTQLEHAENKNRMQEGIDKMQALKDRMETWKEEIAECNIQM